ncbi:ATP-dependent zinc protease [Halopseudomonas laoshanensis]|uniref:ATP-dependent zinc protease n=3 Tax=Pseudomonadaceae TaxID=135621 RepID=A0A7V7KWT1_9GAMM|nr:ATP-dependent zinc protease [Halopseudomonas laoshanensis]PCD01318.1 ATP-dependent zinc protease [Halopseudomonas pelagia]QFY58858.1 ATP-dependent zinc protease [Halopseudomonas pelagia]
MTASIAFAGALHAEPEEKKKGKQSSEEVQIDNKVVVGWIEKGRILPEHTAVKIKVDSGALTSSMHAVNIEDFKRKGKQWVRYDVPVKDADTGELIEMEFERPVFRRILVRGAGGEDRRPVVKMSICMGDRVYEEQFSLRDRGDMTYPVLIGRRTIEHIGLIDVSRTFMLPLECSKSDEEEERDKQERIKDDEALDSDVDAPEEVEEEHEE